MRRVSLDEALALLMVMDLRAYREGIATVQCYRKTDRRSAEVKEPFAKALLDCGYPAVWPTKAGNWRVYFASPGWERKPQRRAEKRKKRKHLARLDAAYERRRAGQPDPQPFVHILRLRPI